MNPKITALVPCRAGSQRVKEKNIRPFGESSLIEIKLKQLLNLPNLDKIIVSTDDEKVIDVVKLMSNDKIQIENRDKYYASNECSNDEFVKYFADNLNIDGLLLWTHVTSPFCDEKVYERAIDYYLENKDDCDSLVSVIPLKGYVWKKNGEPLNYDFEKNGRWPKTQDIEASYLLNSAIFILPMQLMKEKKDRVGNKPCYFEMNDLESFDIDWEDDFKLAEKIWESMKK